MLRKDELRKLRTLRATRAMLGVAKGNDQEGEEWKKHSWGTCKVTYKRIYGYFFRCQMLQGILKIAVFFSKELNAGQLDPRYEVFINPETGEYITRILEDGTETGWTKNLIENLEVSSNGYSYRYHSKNVSWINPEGARTIKRVLKVGDGGFYGIQAYQKRAKKEKRDKRYEENVARWERESAVPEVTEAQQNWINREVVQKHYLFYKYDKSGVKEGFCTYCEKMVQMPAKYKNNLESQCTVCHKDVELKSIGNRVRFETWNYDGAVMQETSNGNLVIRVFTVQKKFKYPFTSAEHYVDEYLRFVFEQGKMRAYRYDWYKNYKKCWYEETNYFYRYGNYHKLSVYKKNLSQLEKGPLKMSELVTMLRKNQLKNDCTPQKWLWMEMHNPVLEQLVKIGMYGLAKEMADMRYDSKLLNQSGTKLTEILMLDKNRLQRLKAFDKKADVFHVKWLQYEKIKNTQYPDEIISLFAQNKILPDSFKFLDVPLGFLEIKNYLIKQAALSGDSVQQTFGTWRDYMELAKKLKMQTKLEQIYKPANLCERHAALIDISKNADMEKEAEKLEKKWPKVNEVLEGLKKYQYTDGKYTISTPSCVYDIVREGTLLSHCIHTVDYYWDRISRRESYIFFLRKATSPDAPWYTLEVEPGGTIRQKRTTGDNQNPDLKPAEPFLKEWQKEIKKVLTDEDKRLAEESEKLRKKGYADLRKKGERIRRGKLAGQLLADVLEKDLMAAV